MNFPFAVGSACSWLLPSSESDVVAVRQKNCQLHHYCARESHFKVIFRRNRCRRAFCTYRTLRLNYTNYDSFFRPMRKPAPKPPRTRKKKKSPRRRILTLPRSAKPRNPRRPQPQGRRTARADLRRDAEAIRRDKGGDRRGQGEAPQRIGKAAADACRAHPVAPCD
jgi:hypothetical protein